MTYDFDVIVYGTICLDLIWRVDRLAAPGAYESILEERRMIGGEAANTAIALSRWGLRVALIGTAMGDDDDGRLLRRLFAADAPDIDMSAVSTLPGLQTAYCVCIATPDGHRTMYGKGFADMQCPILTADFARRGRVFTMDPNAYQAGLRACMTAVGAGLQAIAMDYTRSPEVNQAATISVTSHEQLDSAQPMENYAHYAATTRDRDAATIVVTCGERGCYVAEKSRTGEPAIHVPTYAIAKVIDSTGAGDIFRAGLIYGHLRKWDLYETARFASAAAALNCTSMGGWGGVRSIDEIAAFQSTAQPRTASS